jgi:hypothetical protein
MRSDISGTYSDGVFFGKGEGPDKAKARAIAEAIISKPHGYALGYVTAAARFLVENVEISLPPLLSLDDQLGICTKRPAQRKAS